MSPDSLSQEHRDAISRGMKGRAKSPETRAKISESMKGKRNAAGREVVVTPAMEDALAKGRRPGKTMNPNSLAALEANRPSGKDVSKASLANLKNVGKTIRTRKKGNKA